MLSAAVDPVSSSLTGPAPGLLPPTEMKILLALQGFPPEMSGGTERYVLATALELQARGHEIVILAGTLEGRKQVERSESEHEGLRVLRIHRDDLYFERWDHAWHPGVSKLVQEILQTERPDLFHVNHWFRLTTDLVRQGALAGVPTLLTLQDAWSTCPRIHRVLETGDICQRAMGPDCLGCLPGSSWRSDREAQTSLQLYQSDMANERALARRVFVLSRHQAGFLARLADAPQEGPAPEVLPFRGVRPLRTAPKPEFQRPFRIVNWGTQSLHKGSQVLLEAVARMRHRSEVEVHMLGGCFDADFDQRLQRLAQGSPVLRPGPFDYAVLETTPYHVAVFPSICHETYGLALDEAQELGIPALVSSTGAYSERIGEGGLVFPSGDAAALASLLDQLVEDPARLSLLRNQVPKPKPFSEHVDFLLEAYEATLADAAPDLQDGFDVEGHLAHEFSRFDHRERILLGQDDTGPVPIPHAPSPEAPPPRRIEPDDTETEAIDGEFLDPVG